MFVNEYFALERLLDGRLVLHDGLVQALHCPAVREHGLFLHRHNLVRILVRHHLQEQRRVAVEQGVDPLSELASESVLHLHERLLHKTFLLLKHELAHVFFEPVVQLRSLL